MSSQSSSQSKDSYWCYRIFQHDAGLSLRSVQYIDGVMVMCGRPIISADSVEEILLHIKEMALDAERYSSDILSIYDIPKDARW